MSTDKSSLGKQIGNGALIALKIIVVFFLVVFEALLIVSCALYGWGPIGVTLVTVIGLILFGCLVKFTRSPKETDGVNRFRSGSDG